ncbi:MAG: CoA pyrophosphatase, partial [Actinomycetia bacterium]|nr:CoA pyrophosphatase [Actinomycetes bacterium]
MTHNAEADEPETQRVAPADALPQWLSPVAEGLHGVSAETLSPRMPAPPETASPAAVLMLFGEGDNGPDILITERAHTLRSHPGQLSFPGGRADQSDGDLVTTALREAYEEVGLDPACVAVIGDLPRLWMPPSNTAVTTIVGWWRVPGPVGVVDEAEVATVLRVPIAHLLDPRNRFTVRLTGGYTGPAFDVGDGLVLWGFTAGIVIRLFALVGWVREWVDSGVRSRAAPPAT